jgi:hypothetical protein
MTKQFYVDLRKYAQDRLEEIINEGLKQDTTHMQPLKVSLINISLFCTNALIEIDRK